MTIEIPRDRWLRPLIIPEGGGEPIGYGRPSGLGKILEDSYNLDAWKQRKVLEGVLRRPDLLTRASGAISTGDPDGDYATKKALNGVCREAREAAGSSKGSSAGTGLHSLTEAIDRGLEPLWVGDDDRARLDAYRAAMAPYEVLDIETFVVVDSLRMAGTFDRLVRCPDGRARVADLKTGKSEAAYPFGTTVQIAVYANGCRYDPETAVRSLLHADLDLTTGLLIHLPPSGGCEVIPLNLELGWQAAQQAIRVQEIRSWKAADLIRQAVAS